MSWNRTYRANGHPKWPPFSLTSIHDGCGTGYYATYAIRLGNLIGIHWHSQVIVTIDKRSRYKLTESVCPSWRAKNPRPYLSQGTISRVNGLTPFDIHALRGWVYHTDSDGIRTPLHDGITVDVNGKCISHCPKMNYKLADASSKEWRETRNTNDRASSAARRAQQRAQEYIDGKRTIEQLKPDDVFKIRNAAHRTAIMAALGGSEKVLASMPTRLLHEETVGDNPYQLVEVMLTPPSRGGWDTRPQPQACKYLKMTNPSTDEAVLEGVDRSCRTVRDALRWRDGDDQMESEKNDIAGHRFAPLTQEYVVPSQLT